MSMLLKKKRQIGKKKAKNESNHCLHTTFDPFMTLEVKKIIYIGLNKPFLLNEFIFAKPKLISSMWGNP